MASSGQDRVFGLFSTPSNLDRESYTAQRLLHASHEHLHLTSKRCFIGPIPEAWLSRHRKSWYQHRPHLSTYSSRTATFHASNNISYSKQLTGLSNESHASNEPRYTGPSFPQPDDVSADDPTPEDERSLISVEPVSKSTAIDAPSKIIQSKQVDFRIPTDDASAREQQSLQSSQRPSLIALNKNHRSSYSEGNNTFVTAPESIRPSGAGESSKSVAVVDSAPDSSHLEPLNTRDSTMSTDVSKNRASVNSRSPLLRLSSGPDTSTERLSQSKVNSNEDLPSSTGDRGAVKAPVSNPTVHFDTSRLPKADRLPPPVQVKDSLFRNLLHENTEPGELVKADRMLVRVDTTKHDINPDFTENESLRIESSVVDNWREYMVVCRRSRLNDDEDDDSFMLCMSKTRVLRRIDQKRTSSKYTHSIPLQRKVTRVNMYSSLDKSIVLWHKSKKGTRIYVLRPHSSAKAVEWYTFLNTLLGWRRPESLSIRVPDLNVTLNINRPFEALKDIHDELLQGDDISRRKSFEIAARDVVAHDIISRCARMLAKSPMSDSFETWLSRDTKIGLAWKRYDRLEWVHGANEEKMYGSMALQTTHELELRPKQHYPTCIAASVNSGEEFKEPSPVEGFLVRLTSQEGRHKRFGKSFFKRLYFATHDQYLCFSLPSISAPPKPPKLRESHNVKSVPKASKLAESIPLIYTVDPYPLKNGSISWLTEGTAQSIKFKDELALEEVERRMQTLLQAKGLIDLTQVKSVRKYRGTTAGQTDDEFSAEEDREENAGQSEQTPRTSEASHNDHIFELVLSNGLVVRLQAYDVEARNEWIRRLRRLSQYWKLRTAADMRTYKSVRQENLNRLDITEEMESSLGQYAQKWEVTRAVASAEVFNMCTVSCCRSITMAGFLFYKPRIHTKFRRAIAILCDGKLLLFQSSMRKSSGKKVPHIHHELMQTIELKDTYVYSGLVTENELLYSNQTFDNNRPGHHALPRVYLEDGWTSSDEDAMTCFVIWHGKSRSLFRAESQQEDGKTQRRLRYVASLGRSGRAIVFKPRSRAERDRWVMSIAAEVERLQVNEDLRVVET